MITFWNCISDHFLELYFLSFFGIAFFGIVYLRGVSGHGQVERACHLFDEMPVRGFCKTWFNAISVCVCY